eukprot:6446751-Pyramimonas_sp.AAC.1
MRRHGRRGRMRAAPVGPCAERPDGATKRLRGVPAVIWKVVDGSSYSRPREGRSSKAKGPRSK